MKFTSMLLKNVSKPVSNEIALLRKANILPDLLHQITIGQLLGDAGCYGSSIASNSRIEWSFGKNREAYAMYIADLFSDYTGTGLSSRVVKSTSGDSKESISYRLKTLSLPVFNYYRHLLYIWNQDLGKYVKVVPSNIEELISPVVLAHLVMGDGSFQPEVNTVRIYTNGFTKFDNQRLADAIQNKYGIYVGVRHDRNNQYILAIGAKEILKFQTLVAPHFHQSMLYRIGL
jgi:hypothetical protein